ncbi:glycoside hydrolase [Meira miltonrushii]|uniref:Glycoside hydrolase n=1 Tax=Meira miltonrushii TaxID=1280837 RepID=A0A316VAM3_9BASI|nr:glycoside hydrolase [Meira miltonrushii]PWN34679.1 glycoside hydrolase [Meira miltonrushii]
MTKKSTWQSYDATDLSSKAIGSSQMYAYGRHFVDGYGRIIQLRGMNVSGANKLPSKPDGLFALTADQFFAHQSVSFVGRPFSLADAPLHFARIKAWGYTCIRFLVTWESISHSGPDPDRDMDLEYVEYLEKLIDLLPQFGLKIFICAHQDVWSRFSGGSGAPAWTFEKAGLDIEAFKPTGAAYIPPLSGDDEAQYSGAHPSTSKKKEPVGAFVWPSGYQKAAAATMATLFWNGERVAWTLKLPSFNANITQADELNIQEYLQASYIETFGKLMDRLGKYEAVIGFDLMNEPHRGYVGTKDWNNWCYETDLHIGHYPSLLQSLALASGYKQEIPFYVKSWPFPTRKSHKSVVDPMGKSVWLSDKGSGECVWRAHGAWQWDKQREQPVVLCEDFFTHDPRPGKGKKEIEWYKDCYAPFIHRLSERIGRTHKHLHCFVEPIPNEFFPPWSNPDVLAKLDRADRDELAEATLVQDYAVKTYIDTPRPPRFIYSPHFYDLNVLFGKIHSSMSVDVQSLSRGGFILRSLFFGKEGLKKNYQRQISKLVDNGQVSFGSMPTVIGEVGIPWDINGGHALRTGDYSKQEELLDALIEAMEQAQAGFTLWNYNPDNTTQKGDGWNQEDFSVMCNDAHAQDIDNPTSSEKDLDEDFVKLHRGGRALSAIIRPYATKVAGYPIHTKWDRNKLLFDFHYVNPPVEIREAALHAAGKSAPARSEEAMTTKVFVPRYHFDGLDIRVQVSDGEHHLDLDRQTLSVKHANNTPGFTHKIRISVNGPLSEEKLSDSQRALVHHRAIVKKRREKLIDLSFEQWGAILVLSLGIIISMVIVHFGLSYANA